MNILKRSYFSIKITLTKIIQCFVKHLTNLYLYIKCYIFVGHEYQLTRKYWKTWEQMDDEFYIVRKGLFEEYKCKHCGYTKTILKQKI